MPQASLLGLLNVLLRHRWLVLGSALAALAASLAVTLMQPRTYKSTSAFMPQSRQSANALPGFAAQLGVGLTVGDPMQSPQFYVELVQSREILAEVAETRYNLTTDSGVVSGTLAELYDLSAPTTDQRQEQLLRRLDRQITASQTAATGIVRLSVTTEYRGLSPQIASRILELTNAFNLQTRQSQARAERHFIERRLDDVRSELRTSETRLQGFLQRNREFGASSVLNVERERLEREVSTQRALYTELAQNLERARMEEVRDTPLITVLERPHTPALPESRGVLRNGAFALVAGGLVGVLLAFVRQYARTIRDLDLDDYGEFVRLRHESLRDVRHPLSAVARAVRGQSGTS